MDFYRDSLPDSQTRTKEKSGGIGQRGNWRLTDWMEPRLFSISCVDEKGKIDRKRRPIYIGSGTIESAIRRVINLRIKAPGQFWLLENAEKMIFLRSQVLTERWHSVLDKTLRRIRNNFYKNHLNYLKMTA